MQIIKLKYIKFNIILKSNYLFLIFMGIGDWGLKLKMKIIKIQVL